MMSFVVASQLVAFGSLLNGCAHLHLLPYRRCPGSQAEAERLFLWPEMQLLIDRACCGRACMLCSGARLQPSPTYPRTHLNQRGVWVEHDHRAALCRSGMLSCVSIGRFGAGLWLL
jgi:hypothetical protein